MKRIYLLATALAALVSCTSDDFMGDSPGTKTVEETTGEGIAFAGGFKAVTRGDYFGADAAEKLSNKFYVVAFRGDGSDMSQTFDNYLVKWTANTAGTTTSNTSDWEYVGETAPAWSGIAGNTQTIKYWDFSNTQYDFIAWSPGTATAAPLPDPAVDPSAGTVYIGKPTANSPYGPTYTLRGSRDDLAKCYIADMVTAYKANMTPVQPKFQEEVQFSFRNLACKVRVALYETVPGYSVKDVKFYVDDATAISAGISNTNAYLFTSGSGDNNKFFTAGTYTVSFTTIGDSNLEETDYNKAHVDFEATGSDTKENFGALVLTGPETGGHEATGNNYLGRTLPTASYANPESAGSPYYKTMLPNEDGTVLELRVDYTLLATDGSREEITVHGAKAFVPAIYAAWKPNYAYTYVFKISDNTNGWTSTVTDDPSGLYPITFDAVVVDAQEYTQSTITTVATPSITTYQKGHDVTKDEYLASTGDIYIQVMNNGTLVQGLSTTGDNPIQVWTVTDKDNATEADVMDALNMRVKVGHETKGRNGVTLTKVTTTTDFTTIPGADGNNITITSGDAAKFTPIAGKVYAVTYKGTDHDDSDIYSAEAPATQPDDWATAGVWYKDPDGKTAVDTFEAGKTYYKKYTNRNIDWGVKIIKVQ